MSAEEARGEGVGSPSLRQLVSRLGLLAAVLVGLLLLAGRWGEDDRLDRESFALVSGTIRLADLDSPIEILRDDRGIPHLFAEAEQEGFFALGFAHAQDRLAQMAWLRRRALGTTAEWMGEPGLASDRLARVLAIGAASEATAEALPRETMAVLLAYAEGVNARISRIREARVAAPKHLIGDVDSLEDWRPADSIAVVKLLSWCIGGTLETTLVLDDLIQRLGAVSARPFFPARASVDFRVSPEVSRHVIAPTARSRAVAERLLGSTRALCRGIGTPTGGAWVLAGSQSEDRAPLLMADWHFEPAAPGLFYEAHLAAGRLDVAGATMPGSPIFWAGRNRDFAWASVPASAPISDLFIETLREDRGRYQNGRLWVPFEERNEELGLRNARGERETRTLAIRSTRHGPLIESLWDPNGELRAAETDPKRVARALAWTGARVGDGITSMLRLLGMRNVDGVEAALAEHHEPVLAIVYADTRGGGGLQVAGWLADRPLPTGLVPVQGRLRSFDWRERVPIERLPAMRFGSDDAAPEAPWIVALDQPWPGRGGLDQLEWLWRPGDRADRLEAALRERTEAGRLDLRAAADLLFDDRAQDVTRVVAAIVGMARRAGPLPVEAAEIARLLERWDGRMNAKSGGAAAYHLVIDHLIGALLREPFGPALFERYLEVPHVQPQVAIETLVVQAARLRRAGGWTDQSRVAEAARDGLRVAWVSLNHRLGPTRSRWSWGGLHRLRFLPFAREVGIVSESLQSMPVPGGAHTLDFARHRPGVSFAVERAALYRLAIDLAAPDGMLSTLAPGQVEHPGHPNYADGITRWSKHRLTLFPLSRLAIEEGDWDALVLEPAP